MNKKTIIFAGFFLLMGLMFFPGCPTNGDDGNGQYTLTVTVSSGVGGTPTTGAYSYVENSVVNYSYSLQSGYKNLVVTLDGVPIAATGVITVTGNHVLSVSADQIDIRDTWTGQFHYTTSTFFKVEFSGGLDSGTCGGEFDFVPIGGAGTWTLVWPQIDFMLEFNMPPFIYTLTCTGTLTDENHMNGTWIWTPAGITGTWNLERL